MTWVKQVSGLSRGQRMTKAGEKNVYPDYEDDNDGDDDGVGQKAMVEHWGSLVLLVARTTATSTTTTRPPHQSNMVLTRRQQTQHGKNYNDTSERQTQKLNRAGPHGVKGWRTNKAKAVKSAVKMAQCPNTLIHILFMCSCASCCAGKSYRRTWRRKSV